MNETSTKNIDYNYSDPVLKERCEKWIGAPDGVGYAAGLREYVSAVLAAIALNESDANYRRDIIRHARSVIDLMVEYVADGALSKEDMAKQKAHHSEAFLAELSLALLDEKNGNTVSEDAEVLSRRGEMQSKFKNTLPNVLS